MTPEAKVKVGDYVWVDGHNKPWKVEHESVGGLTLLSTWFHDKLITPIPNNFPQPRSDHDPRSQSKKESS